MYLEKVIEFHLFAVRSQGNIGKFHFSASVHRVSYIYFIKLWITSKIYKKAFFSTAEALWCRYWKSLKSHGPFCQACNVITSLQGPHTGLWYFFNTKASLWPFNDFPWSQSHENEVVSQMFFLLSTRGQCLYLLGPKSIQHSNCKEVLSTYCVHTG